MAFFRQQQPTIIKITTTTITARTQPAVADVAVFTAMSMVEVEAVLPVNSMTASTAVQLALVVHWHDVLEPNTSTATIVSAPPRGELAQVSAEELFAAEQHITILALQLTFVAVSATSAGISREVSEVPTIRFAYNVVEPLFGEKTNASLLIMDEKGRMA